MTRNMLKWNDMLLNSSESNELSWTNTVVLLYHHGIRKELQRILKPHRIKFLCKTTNTLQILYFKKQGKSSLTLMQNFLRLECIDCDPFYNRESWHEITTRIKEPLSYAKWPPNNLVKLYNFQIKPVAPSVNTISSNHKTGFINLVIAHKRFH